VSQDIEEKDFMTIDEASKYIGWNRATVYDWVKTLGMETYKFLRNRKTYLALPDVKRLKQIKEKPWTAGEQPKGDNAA
jgi:excisionase family DNA binding protein